MSDLIIRAPTQTTCGNCEFGANVQIGVVECFGVPPTPVLMGARQNLAGQQEANIQLLRPRLDATTAACALHRMKTKDGMN